MPLGKHFKVNMTSITTHANEIWAAFANSSDTVWKSTSLRKDGKLIAYVQARASPPDFAPEAQAPEAGREPVQSSSRPGIRQWARPKASGTLCLDCFWNEPRKP